MYLSQTLGRVDVGDVVINLVSKIAHPRLLQTTKNPPNNSMLQRLRGAHVLLAWENPNGFSRTKCTPKHMQGMSIPVAAKNKKIICHCDNCYYVMKFYILICLFPTTIKVTRKWNSRLSCWDRINDDPRFSIGFFIEGKDKSHQSQISWLQMVYIPGWIRLHWFKPNLI